MGLQRCLIPKEKVTLEGMRLCLASCALTLSRRAAAPGGGCGQGVPGVPGHVGCPQGGGGGGAHVELQLRGWVVVMTRQEQESYEVRQGGDVGWISGNE